MEKIISSENFPLSIVFCHKIPSCTKPKEGDFCLTKLSNSGDVLWQQIDGEFGVGERIVDMVLVEGTNSNEPILACGCDISTVIFQQ